MIKKALVMHVTMTDFRLDDDDPEIGPLVNVGDNRYSAAVTVHGEATYTLAYGPGVEPAEVEVSETQLEHAQRLRDLADRIEAGEVAVVQANLYRGGEFIPSDRVDFDEELLAVTTQEVKRGS